jgi:uncharacterized repeat protein (TIGR04138 family)
MNQIDFDRDSFEDIIAKDSRYDARAYALLMEVIGALSERHEHFSAEDILDEFRELTLDQYGPLGLRVLTEWGLKSCEDIGEMMYNLADSGRVKKDEQDDHESFRGGYDFDEAFLAPFACEG